MKEIRMLAPTAILGYGFPLASFERGMAAKPHVIGVDAGSTDPGPYYLGKGKSFTNRAAVKRDLQIILKEAVPAGIPVVIGTAGGSGARAHVRWTEEIIEEIAREESLRFTMAVISAELDKEEVARLWEAGKITPLEAVPPLSKEAILSSARIVGQIGLEPVCRALEGGAQVVLAGRAYDPVCFAALPVLEGYDPGLALHAGKILECAAIASEPGSGRDSMLGILRKDHFLLKTLNPARRCTCQSVAAHTLYEKSDPFHLHGPGGTLDLTETRYEQVDESTVKVTGTRFVPADYTIKLEGARLAGYRTISIAGVRDPVMIEKIEEILGEVREHVADNFHELRGYFLHFHLYGKNGVMGDLEPSPRAAHELGIIIEAVAATQEEADAVVSFARSTLLHLGYPGRISTAGNLAFPYSPSDFSVGEVYEFSVYHLLSCEDPLKYFPVEFRRIGGNAHDR